MQKERETITHFGECPRLTNANIHDSPRWDDKTLNLLSGLGQISEEGEFEPNETFSKFIETLSEENMWKLFDSST